MKSRDVFQFGEFRVDSLNRVLLHNDAVVSLNRRSFDLMLYFVQNPGRVITKEELLKDVWPGAFVDENTLRQRISALRKALDERPSENSFIAMLPGEGYQFVSMVRVLDPADLLVPVVAAEESSSSFLLRQRAVTTSILTEQRGVPGSRHWIAGAVVAAVLLAIAATTYAWKSLSPVPQVHKVLPANHEQE